MISDDQIIEVACDMNALVTHYGITSAKSEWLITFAHRIAALEREECAQVCDKYASESSNPMNFASNCAEKIRSRK